MDSKKDLPKRQFAKKAQGVGRATGGKSLSRGGLNYFVPERTTAPLFDVAILTTAVLSVRLIDAWWLHLGCANADEAIATIANAITKFTTFFIEQLL
jgi:hypothetical protein